MTQACTLGVARLSDVFCVWVLSVAESLDRVLEDVVPSGEGGGSRCEDEAFNSGDLEPSARYQW